ncbi:apolipoprotein N-acyltransferase [Streptomyces alkaliterrae]|uniref:Apolipoprotein N-acyltransferase n=1 Tax=Streptomyces alkaliterrae TaxID=2213162 RepID=A0A5P0YKI6_9ACTN|nr:apolipoprotein N-acyltransferase [Streptomyces alkaliterrae]MBB1251950.1 apolipoprotein N-acyltransferase [Streptomyces alkaliterrae]MBB1257357.1 apolipoprotein N-acyltransferase [Streptomyces alkaliterrae]MQS00748.1 apolipoprotein N-acyltransferase [Streptomyces alkaliterrae]
MGRLSQRRAPLAAVAFLAGALPAPAFPAPGLWWLAWVALLPWLLLLRSAPGGRAALLVGWLGGTGFVLATHHWLMPSLHVFLLPLAALTGLLWAPWGWLAHRLLTGAPRGMRAAAAVALLPSGWLLIEVVRSWEYLGGPWALLGASQWQFGPALRLASVGGVWLVSVLVVAVNTALVLLLAVPPARRAAGAALLTVVLLTAATAWWAPAPRQQGEARIAVVQPGLTPGPQARFERAAALTAELAGRELDLVVWGESSVGFDLDARPDLMERLRTLASRVEAPLLVNVDARRAGGPGIFKSSVVVDERGPTGERYDKMRLVPFGEYVPLRPLLGWATSVGRAAEEDRRRGDSQVLFDVRGTRIGPLVCFETAFPDMSRQLARDGAGLLVAQSATSSFQESWAPAQHASLGALRAAETGRPVVHATLTGVSAVYGPDGRPVGPALGVERSTAEVYRVPLAEGRTPYVRYGDWLPGLASAAVAAFVLVSLLRRRAVSPSGAAGSGPGLTRSRRP